MKKGYFPRNCFYDGPVIGYEEAQHLKEKKQASRIIQLDSIRSYINGYAEPEIRYGRGQQGIGSLVNTLTKDDNKDLSYNCKLVKKYYGPEKLLMRWVIQLTRDVLPGEELYCYYGVNARFAKPDAGVRDDNDDNDDAGVRAITTMDDNVTTMSPSLLYYESESDMHSESKETLMSAEDEIN